MRVMRAALVAVMLLAFAGGVKLAGWVRLPFGVRPAPERVWVEHLEQGFDTLAALARPAVVHLEAQAAVALRPGAEVFGPWRRFESRSGSGFLVRRDGCIVTSAQAVEAAEHIRVWLADGSELPARVVARDEERDLALLKVNAARPLPTLPLGEASGVKPGSLVVAVGSPFGFEFSFTQGVVSAVGREVEAGRRHYRRLIQTDAALNRGNSGGPLIDVHGKVVGINSALYSPSGTDSGIGFAIPVDSETRGVIAGMLRRV